MTAANQHTNEPEGQLTMTWTLFHGDRKPRTVTLPPPPPWRVFPAGSPDRAGPGTFQTTPELVTAINAALHLRRPLLLTGGPGSGKSSVAEAIAHELTLGDVLRWNVTSRSTLDDAIYNYDALGRLQHNQLPGNTDDITQFVRLGPLGTALIASTPQQPRVLLIDELDKGELDLPGDLLNVLERGEYDIAELRRHRERNLNIAGDDSASGDSTQNDESDEVTYPIERGQICCQAFPIVVMTSNGEREFPAPFLRRCVRYQLATPTLKHLTNIVTAHFDGPTAASHQDLIKEFHDRLTARAAVRPTLAIDQLLNAVHVLNGPDAPPQGDTKDLLEVILRELDHT